MNDRNTAETRLTFASISKGRLLEVTIEKWPFQITFKRDGKGRVYKYSFTRFDGSNDEPLSIPRWVFLPAITQARAIFRDYERKAGEEEKPKKSIEGEQARLI